MPYKLSGTKVVKSDTGEVVKDHPSREKALAHLRALKANVEESSPVLGALLEGFDPGERRGAHGRWIATFHHPVHGRVTSPVEASSSSEALEKAKALKMGTVQSVTPHNRAAVDITTRETSARRTGARDALSIPRGARGANRPEAERHGGFKIGDVVTHETGSREAGGHGPVTFTKQPGLSTVVGLQRNGNLRLKHPATGTTHDVHHSHAQKVGPLHPDYRGKVVQDAYAAQRAELARQAADRARRSGRTLGESAPEVLGALLGAI